MRIILCDDDIPFTQSFAKRLSSAFKDLGIKPEIIVTNTGIDALRQFTQKPTDALFLDIDMPDQDGFSVANELMKMRTKPLIIFLSSLEHLVYQSFAFQPFWFLRKTHLEDLPMVLEKMTKVINNTKVHYTATINGSNISIPISEIFYFESEGHYIQSTILYAVCIVLLLNLLIYFLFVRFGQISRVQTEAALLGLQNECLQQNTKDIANMYETVRALRHDFKNHLLCISSMADEQNICEIKQYIDQLLKQQDAVNKQITFSGNTALDAIVNSKTAAANRVGVQVHTIITTALAGVSPEDITIIIGNALDNAIRAAKDSKGKKVDLQIQPQGMYHSIMISNDIADSVLSRNPSLHTTNPVRHRHGFGIKNMRQAVEHNQGMMRFYEQENRFICDILLLNMQSGNE